MTAERILYRTRQFCSALWPKPALADFELPGGVLTPGLVALFRQMQPSEQSHSLRVLHKLVEQGENHPDLWVAALLHDAGKCRYPLHVWERVIIVLGKAFFPARVKSWGDDSPGTDSARTWRRPFIVAEKHPEWGAELAAQAGATPLAVALIRRHQEELEPTSIAADLQPGQISPAGRIEKPLSLEDQLLHKLHAADSES